MFVRELDRRGIVSQARLLDLLGQTPVDEPLRARIRQLIDADFSTP